MKRSKPYKDWKRPVALLLGILFLFSTFGFTFNAHYCPYKGSSVSLSPEKGCCCSADATTEDNCCQNKSFQVKIKGKYAAPKSIDVQFAKAEFAPLPYDIVEVKVLLSVGSSIRLLFSDSSPPKIATPIFLFVRSILV